MADENTPLITKEDIQDLLIVKKFVRIDSDNYTEEAYDYIKELIDAEHAILFDRSTHRIWTLGEWFGGDVFKENLLYYSNLKVINLDNEILSEIEALSPESTLAYKPTDKIKINAKKEDDKDVLEFDIDVYNLIKKQPTNRYYLFVDEDGKIGIKEYYIPKIELIKQDHIPSQTTVTCQLNIDSTIPLEDWDKFEIRTQNCDISHIDKENTQIILEVNPNNYVSGIEEKVEIIYNDGYNNGHITFNGIFNVYCYYGYYNPDDFKYYDLGSYVIDNDNIDYVFKINQQNIYYGYFRCPIKYNPLFIDNRRYSQGAWKSEFNVTINEMQYQTYITNNPGLGNIEWKVIENINS